MDSANKIAQLQHMDRSAFITEWIKLHGNEPSEFLSNSLLIRILTHRLQIQEHGDLTPDSKSLLNRMVHVFKTDPRSLHPKMQVKIGTRLHRIWKGRVHEASHG